MQATKRITIGVTVFLAVFISIFPIRADLQVRKPDLSLQDPVGKGSLSRMGKVDEFGLELSQITYKEPGLMSEKGTMLGFSFSTASYGSSMLKAESRFSSGSVNYEGSYVDGTPLSMNNIPDFGYELRFLGGKRISASNEPSPCVQGLGELSYSKPGESAVYLYTGFGYRYLNDNSSAFAGGYEREANYFYSPVGIEIIPAPVAGDNWSRGATLEYDIFWSGKQISRLSDADPGYNDMVNVQNQGYGYRLAVKFQNPKTVIAPFIRYWNIKKSEDTDVYYYGTYVGYGYEPENNSTEIGVKIGVRF